jgi:hypothetical protein
MVRLQLILFSKRTGAFLFRTFVGFLHVPTTQIYCLNGAIISKARIANIYLNTMTRSSTLYPFCLWGFFYIYPNSPADSPLLISRYFCISLLYSKPLLSDRVICPALTEQNWPQYWTLSFWPGGQIYYIDYINKHKWLQREIFKAWSSTLEILPFSLAKDGHSEQRQVS